MGKVLYPALEGAQGAPETDRVIFLFRELRHFYFVATKFTKSISNNL